MDAKDIGTLHEMRFALEYDIEHAGSYVRLARLWREWRAITSALAELEDRGY